MKIAILFFVVCVGILIVVLSIPVDPKGSCKAEFIHLYHGDYSKSGQNSYFTVKGFDPNNEDCVRHMLELADHEAIAYKPGVTVHFLDDLPDFVPPGEGKTYGSTEIQDRVILQYLYTTDRRVMKFWDPFGTGKYQPPSEAEPAK